MAFTWGCVVLFIIASPTPTPSLPPTEKSIEPGLVPRTLGEGDNSSIVTGTKLFGPVETKGIYDVFRYEHNDYLFLGQSLSHKAAALICDVIYHGHLAIIKTPHLGSFLAEALSETNLILDALWTAGEKLPGTNRTLNDTNKTWYWIEPSGEKNKIGKDMVNEFVETGNVLANNRDCLTFARKYHNYPQYQPITCDARRPTLCVRPAGGGDNNGSTHPGWIKLGRNLYKIFATTLNYDDARDFCVKFDMQSRLAVVLTYNYSQQLGRYLLIGRPSLENGWLGARWRNGSYEFQTENFVLDNNSNLEHFPPWRAGHVQKTGGCLLLDRHIANITLFVEARCERLRPTICYKKDTSRLGNLSLSDIIVEPHGYRVIYNNKTWPDARDFCKIRYASFYSKLVEIDGDEHRRNLLYAMGENKTALQHIWIGGTFDIMLTPPKWVWDTTRKLIPYDSSMVNWVINYTYTAAVESTYTCLNMDRENHVTALHYGTDCGTEQPFVCQFSADNLRKLEEYERNNTAEADNLK